MNQDKNRSSISGSSETTNDSPGVGARHTDQGTHQAGGGYPNSCTSHELLPGTDRQIEALKKIGLSRVWIDIANEVGMEKFLNIWDLLEHAAENNNDNNRRIRIPQRSSLDRYYRNLLIASLKNEGKTATQIVEYLKENLNLHIESEAVYKIQ